MFKYKFNTNSVLLKYKTYICIQNDLQITKEETYTIILTICTFRAIMAIVIAFNLKIKQYNIINIFYNNNLEKDIYCHSLPRFPLSGQLFLL